MVDIDFSKFPLYLREGPWTWTAYGTLLSIFGGLVSTAPGALATFVADTPTDGNNIAYGLGTLFGASILAVMLVTIGSWPLTMYTMVSWCMTSLRYALIFCGLAGRVTSMLRFPSLAQHSTVVTVWWLVLVPIFGGTMPKAARQKFFRFNMKPFLLCVHLLDLPLAVVDACFLTPRRLTFADLWLAVAVAFAYAIFYLVCLDPRGLHFYIILSPRTRFMPLVYGILIAFYYGTFLFWDGVVQRRLAQFTRSVSI